MKESKSSTETKINQDGYGNTIDNSQGKGSTTINDRKINLSLGGLASIIVAGIIAGGGSVFLVKDNSTASISQINNEVSELKLQLDQKEQEIASLKDQIQSQQKTIETQQKTIDSYTKPEGANVRIRCLRQRDILKNFIEFERIDIVEAMRLEMKNMGCEQNGVSIP